MMMMTQMSAGTALLRNTNYMSNEDGVVGIFELIQFLLGENAFDIDLDRMRELV
jgi:hypothetical protein